MTMTNAPTTPADTAAAPSPDPNAPPSTPADPKTPTPSTSASGVSAESTTDLGTDTPPPPADPTTDLGADDAPQTEDAPAPWAEYHGAPVDDKGAPVDYQFQAPDGVELDTELAAEFSPIARELNLSSKGAQKIADMHAKAIQLQTKRWGDHVATLKTSAMADPQIGGANYVPTVQAARTAITKVCGPRAAAFREMCNKYGVGNHPEMLYMLGQVGKLAGEPAPTPSGAGSGVVTEKPLYEKMYKDT